MNFTVPAKSLLFAKCSATPIRIATWVSWPQACITPVSCPLNWAFTLDLKGSWLSSVTGSPSISARKAKTFPGRFPLSRPITPVWAIPVSTSMPSARKWAATFSAVLNSRLESSGFWWISWRHWMTLASNEAGISWAVIVPSAARKHRSKHCFFILVGCIKIV